MTNCPKDISAEAKRLESESLSNPCVPLSELFARAILAERERCAGLADYCRENIKVVPKGRKRFDVYDINFQHKDTCRVIKEMITGEDDGKWVANEDAKGGDA